MAVVQLVQQDDAGGLKVCEEGVKTLRELPPGVRIIAMAGLYRSGKSLLLNRMAHWFSTQEKGLDVSYAGGFKVGSTTESCTRGIWMTIVSDANVVLLDTEGLASVDQDETYDCKIFTLGLLLSSFFVYNSVGVIDESAIDRLYMVGKLAQTVSKNNKIGFSLLWILRDFSLQLDQFNNDPNEYLEDALGDKSKRNSNEQRQEIRKIFRNRQCCTLVRPVMDEKLLQELDTAQNDQLRPEFLQQMNRAFETIDKQATTKKLAGHPLDGSMLTSFLESCLEAINSGGVPDIKKTFQYVAENSYRELKERALDQYSDDMIAGNANGHADWLAVLKVHEAARKRACDLFLAPSVVETASKAEFIAHLNETLADKLIDNLWPTLAHQSVQETQRYTQDVLAVFTSETFDVNQLPESLARLERVVEDSRQGQQYLGPERHEVLARAWLEDLVKTKLLPLLAKAGTEIRSLQEKVNQMSQVEQGLRKGLEEERLQAAVTTEQLEASKERLVAEQKKTEQVEQQLEEVKVRLGATETKLDSEINAHRTTVNNISEMQTALEKARSRASEEEDMANALRQELEAIIVQVQEQQDDFDASEAKLQQEVDELQVRLCLNDTISAVERKVLTTEKNRAADERQALHTQLQEFHLRASTLPDLFQSHIFGVQKDVMEYF